MPKSLIKNEEFFVIRIPRLPINILHSIPNTKEATALAINNWLANPAVTEALYLASPSLQDRIHYWQKDPHSKQAKKIEKALFKYLIRMTSRATPFGLFSGISLGSFEEKTDLLSNNLISDKRKTRLDMFYLSAIKEYLLRTDRKSKALKYYPNPSHYFVAGQCRYIEAYQSKYSRQYRLNAIEPDNLFLKVFEICKQGMSFVYLVEKLSDALPEESSQDINDYLELLINESILVADIPLPLTGDSPDKSLVKSIQKLNCDVFKKTLSASLSQLDKLDRQSTSTVPQYKNLLKKLNALPVKAEENKLFQVDTYRDFKKCSIDQYTISNLSDKLNILKVLGRPSQNIFSQFIKEFNSRFEGQLVSLTKLLDDESGISFSNETGYETPLLAGLNLAKMGATNAQSNQGSLLDNLITQAISAPENRSKPVIQLKSKELKKYLGKNPPDHFIPASFAALISLYEDTNNDPIIKFNGCYGPSAANLLGRFCHLDNELLKNVRQHLLKEEDHSKDVVFAEVVHMPEDRPGNVIARPHLRQYEIVFLADSSIDSRYQIAIDDLYVWIEDGQVKLWSKKLQKQVIPRLSSAHNYSARSLSIYKFLCMLQRQFSEVPYFSLPASQSQTKFVPRIMLDNIVLSEKTWRIPRNELAKVLVDDKMDQKILTNLQEKYQLDSYVSFSVSDNVLQLDLRNPIMLDILLSETKSYQHIELKEVLINQYRSPVVNSDGDSFANEIIVPFFNQGAKQHITIKDKSQFSHQKKSIKRNFLPGSEWLSIKLYAGNSAVEELLTNKLLPFIKQHRNYFQKWFFIRYGDPDWHLRLRFNGEPKLLYGKLLPALNRLLEPMLEDNEIHNVEIFTYQREIDRYGGQTTMKLVESLFMTDSTLVANTVKNIPQLGEDLRWRIAILYTNCLLQELGYTDDEKLNLLSNLRDGFGREFNDNSLLRKQLGNRYRQIEPIIKEDLNNYVNQLEQYYTNSQKLIFLLIDKWKAASKETCVKLLKILESGENLTCSRDELVSSILHMHNNRIFKSYGREQEFLMHDFLRRYYFSKQHKIRKTASAS